MSHGKNACDGISGTIKQTAAYASLQRSVTRQILSPKSLLQFANSEIPGIQLFWVPTTEIIENNIFWRKGLRKAVHYQDQDLTTSLGHLQTRGRS